MARLKVSVAANVTLTRSSPDGSEALVPPLVEHEPRVLDALTPLDRRNDRLRARHLRDAVVTDEAHRLDPRQARRREPVDELARERGRERLRLVLETVPRPDVAERDAHRRSLVTRDG